LLQGSESAQKNEICDHIFWRVITRAWASPQARLPFFGASPGNRLPGPAAQL